MNKILGLQAMAASVNKPEEPPKGSGLSVCCANSCFSYQCG